MYRQITAGIVCGKLYHHCIGCMAWHCLPTGTAPQAAFWECSFGDGRMNFVIVHTAGIQIQNIRPPAGSDRRLHLQWTIESCFSIMKPEKSSPTLTALTQAYPPIFWEGCVRRILPDLIFVCKPGIFPCVCKKYGGLHLLRCLLPGNRRSTR